MTRAPIRTLVAGLGTMGRSHALAYHRNPAFDLVGLVNRSTPKLDAELSGYRIEPDFNQALTRLKPDLVNISTYSDSHADYACAAMEAGAHVFVEKPLATTVEDLKSILAWDEKRSAMTWMGLEYRFMPPVAEAIARAKEGEAGKIHQVSIREHREPFYPKVDNWNRFAERTGGTLVEKCCHYFNLMDIVVGEQPVRVFASGGQSVNHLDEKYDGKQADMLDNAYVVLEYANGARGMLDLCMFGEGSFDKEILTIVGDEGKIESFLPSQVVRASRRESIGKLSGWSRGASRARGNEQKIVHNYDVKYMGHHYGASYIEHTRFRDAILNSTPAEVTLKDGVTSVVTGLAAHKSIKEGRVVEIKELWG